MSFEIISISFDELSKLQKGDCFTLAKLAEGDTLWWWDVDHKNHCVKVAIERPHDEVAFTMSIGTLDLSVTKEDNTPRI